MLRCAELHLSDEALEGMTMGMVYDMLIEQANDHEQYPYKATQADIERSVRQLAEQSYERMLDTEQLAAGWAGG